jgi:hypothetical protein
MNRSGRGGERIGIHADQFAFPNALDSPKDLIAPAGRLSPVG